MSKKQFHNRLNSLFSSLNDVVDTPALGASSQGVSTPSGWHWTADQNRRYLSCSAEIACLGFSPQEMIHQPVDEFLLDPSSIEIVKRLFLAEEFPSESEISIRDASGTWRKARFIILNAPVNGESGEWHGIIQLSQDTQSREVAPHTPSHPEKTTTSPNPSSTTPLIRPQPSGGVRDSQNVLTSALAPRTPAGKLSLKERQVKVIHGKEDHPATIAVPVHVADMGDMLIEVVDETERRTWSEDEQQMVMDVATQLSLALENARLYQAAQQELAERMRAEEVILHRNRDLAMLNQIGQRLTGLTSRDAIFNTLAEMAGQVLDDRNLYICILDQNTNQLSFPVYREYGASRQVANRPAADGIPEYLMASRSPLLITHQAGQRLAELGIKTEERVPASLIGIPIPMGSHQSGALVIQDFEQENAPQFDEVHLELLSTAAAQAATAIENANLFQQMQEALKAIENRERYQAGVARAVATLSEFGAQALGDVLRYLGQASQANRVYLLHYEEGSQSWRLVEDWTSPLVAYLFDRSKIHQVNHEIFSALIPNLRIDGWALPLTSDQAEKAQRFFSAQNIQSVLILSISGSSTTPDLLIFEQIDQQRQWQRDEINLLRVAADAIANTYIRENLLAQLRANLDETESLYNASNRLAISNDFQEMLAAVINGVKPAEINRGAMLLFDVDAYNKVSRISIQANWYSGHGTPPPPVGVELPRPIYDKPLQNSSQAFYEDIREALMDEAMRQELLRQNVTSLCILPMISGKRQIGALLLEGERRHAFTNREKRLLPPLVDQLTIAVENLRLFEQTQTALAETALLYNITSGIAQAQEPEDMVSLVVNNVLPRGADCCFLFLADLNEDGEMTGVEVSGFYDSTGKLNLKGTRFDIQELPVIRILPEEGLAVSNLDDPVIDRATHLTLERHQIQSVCFVPMRTGGRSIGALAATARVNLAFDPADVRLFRTVANGVAVAVEKQRLLREAQRRALELQTASEIARDTTSTLALDVLLSRMVNLLVQRFGFYHTSIYLVDAQSQFAVIREATEPAGTELKRRGHKVAIGSRSVIGTVVASGQPLILNDVASSDLFVPNSLLPQTRAEIGLPLKVGDRIIGALDIHAATINAFSKDDVFVLGILADQIAIAIENARAYELSQKAIEDMREVDRVKSQFLANMSHELRTPLNSIIGFSRVILKGIDGPINELQTQDLTAIYNSGQHLLMLINDILDLSKIEAGKMELSFSDVNLLDLINSAMSTAVGLVKDKPIKLLTNLPENLPLVRADSIRVRQVLINFLSNAAKFTEEGSITVEARQQFSPDGKPEIMVTVADTGPGIAPEDQSKLFLPFSQVDDSPTRKTGGTGLGLSICRSLIELHGGRIGLLSSEVGKGSTFFFTLPLPVTESVPMASTLNEGCVVLAIDDDLQVIHLYERYLQPQGYQIIPHTNPRTAVERAKEVKPFAITLDIMMPEMDGWQVMKALKNDPETRDIPIVVCSILEEEEKGFNLGAADYLVKPFLSEDLLNALNRLNFTGEIKNILVIDDDPEDLRLVQKMIEANDRFHVQLAQGGEAGWESIQQNVPDAIILDLFMPDLNGFDLLAKLRSEELYQNIPVIILTGADLTPEQHKELKDFGHGLYSKGFLREKELLNSLESALRQFRSKRKVS